MPRDPAVAATATAATATAINLKRLLSAQDAASGGHTDDPAARTAAIYFLTGLLARVFDEIGRFTAADSSTGS